MLYFYLVKFAARVLVAVWRYFRLLNLQKIASSNQEFLKYICNKHKEIKALRLENSKLKIEINEAEGNFLRLPFCQLAIVIFKIVLSDWYFSLCRTVVRVQQDVRAVRELQGLGTGKCWAPGQAWEADYWIGEIHRCCPGVKQPWDREAREATSPPR